MSKHSPFDVLPGRGYGQLNGSAIRDQRGYVVAVVLGDVPEIDTDGIAVMMAASADLLDALKRVRAWIDNWSPDFVCDEEWPEDEARMLAAIAKAEGRS